MSAAAARFTRPSSRWPKPSEIVGGAHEKNRSVGGPGLARRARKSASSSAMFAAPSSGSVTSSRNAIIPSL